MENEVTVLHKIVDSYVSLCDSMQEAGLSLEQVVHVASQAAMEERVFTPDDFVILRDNAVNQIKKFNLAVSEYEKSKIIMPEQKHTDDGNTESVEPPIVGDAESDDSDNLEEGEALTVEEMQAESKKQYEEASSDA